MESSPYLSVVVPTYNCEQFIEETVQSLLNEKNSLPWLEIIVVDDGSTDNTENLLQKFSDQITYIKQANQGQSAALNHGWEKANGKYLSYLSSDDLIYTGWLQKAYDFLKNSELHVGCYPNYDLIDEQSRVISFVNAPSFSRIDLISKSLCQPGPGAVFKKSAFIKTSGWNTHLRQTPDFDFWIRLTNYGELSKIDFNGAGFRVHQDSQSYASPSFEKAEEPVFVIQSFLNSTPKEQIFDYSPSLALANAHLLSARLHARSFRFIPFLRHSYKSLSLSPFNFFKLSSLRLIASGWVGRIRFQIKKYTHTLFKS